MKKIADPLKLSPQTHSTKIRTSIMKN